MPAHLERRGRRGDHACFEEGGPGRVIGLARGRLEVDLMLGRAVVRAVVRDAAATRQAGTARLGLIG